MTTKKYYIGSSGYSNWIPTDAMTLIGAEKYNRNVYEANGYNRDNYGAEKYNRNFYDADGYVKLKYP